METEEILKQYIQLRLEADTANRKAAAMEERVRVALTERSTHRFSHEGCQLGLTRRESTIVIESAHAMGEAERLIRQTLNEDRVGVTLEGVNLGIRFTDHLKSERDEMDEREG